MKSTPDDGCARSSLDPDQLDALTKNETGHYTPISDFH
jgi:hypothetical protein